MGGRFLRAVARGLSRGRDNCTRSRAEVLLLRIEQRQEGDTVIVHVEGRLAGPWVQELENVLSPLWGVACCVALDLGSVGYVDAAGERLLSSAIRRGARIRRSSSFVATLLDVHGGGSSK